MADAETGKILPQTTGLELSPLITPHPVTAVLERHAEQIGAITSAISILPNDARQQYLGENLGFLADAIEGIDSFSLTQESIEEIWRKAYELKGDLYFRYRLMGMIGFSYLLQGLSDREGLEGSTDEFVKTWDIPDERTEDGRDRRILWERYYEIHSIVHGFTTSVNVDEISVKWGKFNERRRKGNPTTEEEERLLEEESGRFEEELERIGDIQENFANGFNIPISFALDEGGSLAGPDEDKTE